jgi:hypothetical protein
LAIILASIEFAIFTFTLKMPTAMFAEHFNIQHGSFPESEAGQHC